MSVSLLLAGALLAQASPAVAAAGERIDVAYEELRSGDNRGAVDKIRSSRLVRDGDPSALINLGSAYARLGQRDAALDCYRNAIVSQDRYDVQLADGSWVDSRRAARMAIDALAQNRMLSLR